MLLPTIKAFFDGLNIATVSKETITVWFMLLQLAWGENKTKSWTKFLCSDAIKFPNSILLCNCFFYSGLTEN